MDCFGEGDGVNGKTTAVETYAMADEGLLYVGDQLKSLAVRCRRTIPQTPSSVYTGMGFESTRNPVADQK